MSQELVGSCGAIVGSSDYFQKINQGAIFTPFMMSQDGYYYSSAVSQLCSRCAAVIDEICSDMRDAGSSLSRIPDEHRDNLEKLIANLEEASNFMSPAHTSANECRGFLSMAAANEDHAGILGIWGMDIGSRSYMQSKCAPIFSSIFSDPLTSISQTIISDLSDIAAQIAADIDLGADQHYYVQDENGDALRKAIQELERCNCNALSFHSGRLNSLCWYQNVSSSDVLALQKALNKIPEFDTLTEDGVYGEKTSNNWNGFMDTLAHGTFPSLTFINPLQTDLTGIRIQSFLKHKKKTPNLIQNLPESKLPDSYMQTFLLDGNKAGDQSLFYFDAPHNGYNYYHWNYHPGQQPLIPLGDHGAITEEAFLKLAYFENAAKVVKIGGRILLVTGIALDALEIGTTMYSDLNDADGKLGRTTISTTASIAGEWGGSIAGAKLGAMAGATIGSVFPGPGTLIGGFIVGLAGGIGGAILGESFAGWLAECVMDITGVGE